MSAFLRTASRSLAPPAASRAFSSTASRPVARITIIGNLAGPPELRPTSTGREFLRYSVASNSGRDRKTSWFNVSCFEPEGPRRDFYMSLQKGTLVLVEGSVSTRSYKDSEGNSKQALNITQRNLEILRRPHNPNAGPAEGEQERSQ